MRFPFFKAKSSVSHPEFMPLIKWVWRAYFRTSLVPLLMVEVALVGLYFVSTVISNRENIATVRQLAEEELQRTAIRQANGINYQLEGVKQATEYLRQESERVMVKGESSRRDDPARFAYSREGAFHTTRDTGGSAVFYSGFVPVGPEEREVAYRSAGLDPAFKGIVQSFPLIVQVYFNRHDSLNRIYPYFDVLSQYPAKMDIPAYNFYYEADAKHNPQRKVVWTDVYVDPAGKSWMASAIAPVYKGNVLEGVVGSDVTVATIINDVLNMKLPWDGYGLLVSRSGTILALPHDGESDWGVKEFIEHDYATAIMQDTFKPDVFNLFKRQDDPDFARALRELPSGMKHMQLSESKIVSWATIPETGWKLLIAVPESRIYAPARSLAERMNIIAWLMVGGMTVFYLIFFTVLYRRARKMSEFVSTPLRQIDAMISEVAAGQYQQVAPHIPVLELKRTAEEVALMGAKLQSARTLRDRAEQLLTEKKQHLQSVFDLSPDGFIAFDNHNAVSMVNPAFCRITGTEPQHWVGLPEMEFWKKLGEYSRDPKPHQDEVFSLEIIRPKHRLLLGHVSRTAENVPAAAVIYFHDITKEDQLDRMKSEFLATAAHELRTPLTSILGYAELLRNDRLPENAKSETFENILKQSRALSLLIQDLLDISRIESRMGFEMTIAPLAADGVIEEVVHAFFVPSGRAPVKQEAIEPFLVLADQARLRQVLVNILDNAYKYSHEGDVLITTCRDDSLHPDMVGIAVTDHGIGLTADQCELVFDRFWRGDTSGNIPGTGLGMSIAKEFVRLMGGDITLESTPGRGTTVTIWLKAASQ